MFQKVLVGVDGRRDGRDAIALARQLMGPDGKLTLAFVRSGEPAEDLADSNELLEEDTTDCPERHARCPLVVLPRVANTGDGTAGSEYAA